MSAGFDPYHKWLGIPPAQQPPTHYRLLGLEQFENDTDVIDAAANRIMAYLQDVSVGEDPQMAQRMLNEISAARLCLLTPQKKTAYDQSLRQAAAPAAPPAAAPPAARPVAPATFPQATPAAAPPAQPMAQPVAQAAPIQPAPPAPVPPHIQAEAKPAPGPAFVEPSAPVSSGGGTSLLQDRKKDNSVVIWIVGGGVTLVLLVGAFIFASMDNSTGPGSISDTDGETNGSGKNNHQNSLPALLVIRMKPQDRAGAKIEINGETKPIPASGPIEFYLKPGIQVVSITHPDHRAHEEKLGIGPGKEFSINVKW